MANTLANLARMYTETAGTGTLTLISAVPGFNTFAEAGVPDGATITYAIYCGPQREIGAGVWTATTKELTRATVYSSTRAGNRISLSGRSEVFITPAKEDLLSLGLNDGDYGDIVISNQGQNINIDSAVATTFGRSLMDDADATAGRATLQLGSMSTQADNNVSITGGSIAGITDLAVADGGTGVSTLSAGFVKANGTSPFTSASAVNLASEVTGTLPVGNGGTGATTLTGVVKGTGTSALTASAITDTDIGAAAAITHSKLANIPSGQILLGNASNVPTATAVSGDISISNTGVTAIQSGVIVNDDVNATAAIAPTKLAFTQAGTGASARTVDAKLKESISVEDFGAVGDGSATDTTAIQAAIDSLGVAGGTVWLRNNGKYKVGNLTIKKNVRLAGHLAGLDTTSDNIDVSYGDLGSALRTTSGATITLQAGATIDRCILYPDALSANLDQSDASNFAGNAITVAGYGATITNCMIFGYTNGIISDGYSRLHIERNAIDCQTALNIEATFDSTRILHNHCWPYLTHKSFYNSGVNYAARDKTKLYRSGFGLKLADGSDDTQVDGNLFLGFLTGVSLSNVNAVNIGRIWIDHPPGVNRANNVGIYLGNNVSDVVIQTAYVWGVKTGIVCEMNSTEYVLIDLAHIEFIDEHAIAMSAGSSGAGELYINTLHAQTVGGRAVSMTSSASTLEIGSYNFKSITGAQPIATPSNGTLNQIRIGSGTWDGANGGSLCGGNTLSPPTIASADPLVLPVNGDVFLVSGTTGFGTISGGWGGRRITLIFQGALTVFAGGSISLAANLTTAANDVLELYYDGTSWREAAFTGTLPVAYGGTGVTSFGTGVATALGQNVTGSGGIVLAASPTFSGNVGIGISPATALDVNGVITMTNPFGAFAAMQTAGGTGFRWTLNNNATFTLQYTSNGFSSASSPIVINSSANVGINQTSPSYPLDVLGASRFNGNIGFYNKTPIAQPAAVADANTGTPTAADCAAQLNALLSRLRDLGLIAP